MAREKKTPKLAFDFNSDGFIDFSSAKPLTDEELDRLCAKINAVVYPEGNKSDKGGLNNSSGNEPFSKEELDRARVRIDEYFSEKYKEDHQFNHE